MDTPNTWLPANDPQRTLLHNEVHARPPARIHLPALVTYVAVFHEGITREDECAHLRQLPGHEALASDALAGLRHAITTCAPFIVSARAASNPMPEFAPVISTTRPDWSAMSASVHVRQEAKAVMLKSFLLRLDE